MEIQPAGAENAQAVQDNYQAPSNQRQNLVMELDVSSTGIPIEIFEKILLIQDGIIRILASNNPWYAGPHKPRQKQY